MIKISGKKPSHKMP